MHDAPHPSPVPAYLVTAATLAAAALVLVFLRGEVGMLGEDGPVETASVVLLVGAALAFLAAAPGLAFGRLWHVPTLLLLAAARELDWDKSLLSGGILKSRFYTGDYPLWEKAVGLAIVLLILWAGLRLLRHGTPPVLRALRAWQGWAWLTVGGLVTVAVAKGLDGIGRKLRPLGIPVPEETVAAASYAEEWMEMAAAVAVLLAVALWARGRRVGAAEMR